MRALLLKEYNKLWIADMHEPPIGPDDVLVRVKACGIHGSDAQSNQAATKATLSSA
jgi:threonine dehydrogenase-like Zn-dependent dehydrogenase